MTPFLGDLEWHDLRLVTVPMGNGTAASVARRNTNKRRILVAEDDPEMRRVILDALQEDGHDVHTVGDGAGLLIELARSDRFHYQTVDLVIADVRMPLCSGLQALETIRGVRARVPFLLMTAFGDDAVHARAAKLGARLLDKPFSIEKLRREIAALLGQRTR